MLGRDAVGGLVERGEQARHLFARHAGAGVGHLHQQRPAAGLVRPGLQPQGHSAGFGELHGVGQEVVQHLAQPHAVAAHGDRHVTGAFDPQAQALGERGAFPQTQGLGQHGAQVEVGGLHRHAAGAQLGMVQQVVQQGLHHQARVADQLGVDAHLAVAAVAHLGGARQDRADGGAQVMANGGQKGPLAGQRLFDLALAALVGAAFAAFLHGALGQPAPGVDAIDHKDHHGRRHRGHGRVRGAEAHHEQGRQRHVEDVRTHGAGQHQRRSRRVQRGVDHRGRQHDGHCDAAHGSAVPPQRQRQGAVEARVQRQDKAAHDLAFAADVRPAAGVDGREDPHLQRLHGHVGQGPGGGQGRADQGRRGQAAGQTHGHPLQNRAAALPDGDDPSAGDVVPDELAHACSRCGRLDSPAHDANCPRQP